MMQASGSRVTDRAVGYWVLTGTIMLLIQVMLGGITRLTGSGLSITEWNVVTGALPPIHDAQWMLEFNKYKQTPQFQILNAGFGLSDFKFIFFWEWFHRFWARLVGVVFIAGFIYLLWTRRMKAWMIGPLLTLFLLGALQGAIGWIMVASGLTGDAVYVKPAKLALHFVFALGLISYAFWFALKLLLPPVKTRFSRPIRALTVLIISILFIQLIYGALMAGYKAAAVAPTWPKINGDWMPGNLLMKKPVYVNFMGNAVTIHFIHRSLAYLLGILVAVWSFNLYRVSFPGRLKQTRSIPLLLISFQILLGISAVLSSPWIVANHWVLFDWIAFLHQFTGMLFLLSMIYMLFIMQSGKTKGKF